MTDLDEKQQNHVRTALRYLRRCLRGWQSVGDAIGLKPDTVEKVANARGRAVTASVAFRVARLLNAPVDDLLAGRFLDGACTRCGHMPDGSCPCCGHKPGFEDEPTAVEDAPRPMPGGLTLVK